MKTLNIASIKTLLTALVLSLTVPSAWAVVTYNDNITAIFGTGNPNTGWTSDTGSGITLALRAKNRVTGDTTNVSGTYEFSNGTVPPANNRAIWNWEFSINSGASLLTAYDYFIGIDTDVTAATNYTYVNALTYWTDNSYGNGLTLNGAGVEAVPNDAPTSALLAAASSIAQQSQNLVFAGGNPYSAGTYDYLLFAVNQGAGQEGARLAEVGITVSVVPDGGGTVALLGSALLGLAAFRRKLIA